MGAQLVGQAFAFASRIDLKPNEMLLLTWMALRALDTDEHPRSFMSREQLAFGLGRDVPPVPDPLNPDAAAIEAVRSAAFQRVRVGVAGLVTAGAIRSLKRGREGQRAEYALIFPKVLERQLFRLESDSLERLESDSLAIGIRSPWRTESNPPRKNSGLQEKEPGRTQAPAFPHFAPVEKAEAVA